MKVYTYGYYDYDNDNYQIFESSAEDELWTTPTVPQRIVNENNALEESIARKKFDDEQVSSRDGRAQRLKEHKVLFEAGLRETPEPVERVRPVHEFTFKPRWHVQELEVKE